MEQLLDKCKTSNDYSNLEVWLKHQHEYTLLMIEEAKLSRDINKGLLSKTYLSGNPATYIIYENLKIVQAKKEIARLNMKQQEIHIDYKAKSAEASKAVA
jgi:hypothetical protein